MPRQNRLAPTGELVAVPERGLFMGNRGILHDADGRLRTRRWAHANWICCRLEFKGRRRSLMAPGRYTELFFLDEATAFAAGHRPCGECRRQDYDRFLDAWSTAFGDRPGATALDRELHRLRVRRNRTQIRHRADLADLPSGVLVIPDDAPDRPHLVRPGRLHPWSFGGYGPGRAASGTVTVLTPEPTVRVIAAGYAPHVHPSLKETGSCVD